MNEKNTLLQVFLRLFRTDEKLELKIKGWNNVLGKFEEELQNMWNKNDTNVVVVKLFGLKTN